MKELLILAMIQGQIKWIFKMNYKMWKSKVNDPKKKEKVFKQGL